MTVQVDFWHLVGLLLGFFGACAAAGKLLLSQTQRHIDDRFNVLSGRLGGIEQTSRDEAVQWQRVERELLNLKAELPVRYVMRADYIRNQTVVEAKLDAIASKFDSLKERP